jgi:type II secretory pathway pseudopilin PulG
MRRHGQSGYSLLMVVFLVATSLVLSAAVVPNILTQGKRERETEAIWRGEQYERAIGMYFKKFGKYPTKIDDLTKQTNGVRFLRQAYTDPMNKEDGSWRFIYVGPNGQLIGSLRQTSLLQGVTSTPTLPGGAGSSLAAGIASVLGIGQQPGAAPSAGGAGAPGTAPSPTTGATGTPGAPGTDQPNQPANGMTSGGLAPDSLQSQPQPLTGAVIGGNIIGVGSKVKSPSIRVYEGGDTYQEWEFIWNPNTQIAIPGQNSANPVPPPAQPPTQTPQVPAVNAPPVTPPTQ